MKRILIFLAFAFGITYAFDFFIIAPQVQVDGYGKTTLVVALVATTMFIPALSVLLTRWVTHEGFNDVWICPNFKGHVRYYLLAWFLPPILAAVGAAVYFLIIPSNFDSTCCGAIAQMAKAGSMPFTPEQAKLIMFGQLIGSVLFAPVLNCVACFGEEWGWRGYLLPKMLERYGNSRRGIVFMLIANGMIWGLWHAPIIAMGHNYGIAYAGYPYAGILTMCVFTFSLGIILSYLSMRTHSCLPGVVGHGAINGIAAGASFFAVDPAPTLLGPSAAGLIGGSALTVAALFILVLWCRQTSDKVSDSNISEETH